MTNLTDGTPENPSSTNHEAERAWLDRTSPEFRAALDERLGFLDSWQETREQTQAAVDAFADSEKRRREAESIKRMVIPDWKDHEQRDAYVYDGVPEDGSEEFARRMAEASRPLPTDLGEWVDPCPTWDELRPHNIKPGSPHDERLRARYEAGRAEHREDWTKWTVEHVTQMIREEDDDSLIYRGMRRYIMRKLGLL